MTADQPDILVVGKRLPPLHCRPIALARLKERETGGVLQPNGKVRLLPLGEPALTAYPDDAGVWTIGWGITGRHVKRGVQWGRLECEIAFEAHLMAAEAEMRADLKGVNVTQKQFEALISLVYNIGDGAFDASTLLRLLRAGHSALAANEFLRWNKITVDGRKVEARGLTNRRAEEREVFLGAEWRLGA